jgi:hypothetical protein
VGSLGSEALRAAAPGRHSDGFQPLPAALRLGSESPDNPTGRARRTGGAAEMTTIPTRRLSGGTRGGCPARSGARKNYGGAGFPTPPLTLAQERTRTSTVSPPPDPESGVSTNSTTWAERAAYRDGHRDGQASHARADHFLTGHLPSAISLRRVSGFSSMYALRDSSVMKTSRSSPSMVDWQARREVGFTSKA